mmetsp:Transcript_68334/g.120633  ORF Transcript_68334/g.120633 Transcript_68334/m.120633 type:complete len:93 (-) Transcript_68334:670-948(-)
MFLWRGHHSWKALAVLKDFEVTLNQNCSITEGVQKLRDKLTTLTELVVLLEDCGICLNYVFKLRTLHALERTMSQRYEDRSSRKDNCVQNAV